MAMRSNVFTRKKIMNLLQTNLFRLSALGIAGGMLLAACGGSGSTTAANPIASAPSGQNGTAATTTAGGNSNGNGNGDGNSGDSEFGLTEAEVVKRVDTVEASIAACMQDAGFEYVPVDYATARAAMDSNSKPSGLSSTDFRDQYGYGLTTLYGGVDTQSTMGLGRNIAIRDGLPSSDRIAWEHQLLGTEVTQTFVVGLDNEDLSRTGGC